MELKLFTDLIDALGKVAGGLRAIVSLPKADGETMRYTLDETCHLVDTAVILERQEFIKQELELYSLV